MAYDTATVQMLRNILDEVLASSTFIGQKRRSALEIAERILWLASQGEREAATIKQHLLNEFLASASLGDPPRTTSSVGSGDSHQPECRRVLVDLELLESCAWPLFNSAHNANCR
ncbi:hypothetical protein [Bradyrhizobium diazoefficiens]